MIDKRLLKEKDRILELKNNCKTSGKESRGLFEYSWMRNIQFFHGNQWITWSKSRRQWVNINFDDNYTPKPVTNKFASVAGTIKAVLIQKEPRTIIKPAENVEEDIATANLGDNLVDVLGEESKIKEARKFAAGWVVLTGNVFFHNYYDISKDYGQSFVSSEACLKCGNIVSPDEAGQGTCPQCGSNNLVQAIGKDGTPIGQSFDKGRLCIEAVSPFEIYLNQEITDWQKIREVVRAKRVPVDVIEGTYPDLKDKVKESESGSAGGDTGDFYLRSLAFTGSGTNFMSSQGGGQKVKSAVVDYYHRLPDNEFKEGIQMCSVADEIAELGPLETKYQDGSYFLPYVPCKMIDVPGRFWGKTLMDDVAPKQIQRNKFEAFMELIMMRMGKPDWIIPTGTNVDDLTGEPGQKIKYTPGPNGAKPEKMAGSEVPQSVFKMMEMIDNAFEELGKIFDALKGQQPSAQTPFASLRLLLEQGYTGHREMIQNWEQANTEITKQQLEIARAHFDEERISTIKNNNGDWETKAFMSDNLQGGVIIQTEAGSSTPKSQAAEIAGILNSIQIGLIDIQNPKVKHEVLEIMGQAHLGTDIDDDVKDATAEWKDFVNSVNANPMDQTKFITRPRVGIDNEMIHYNDAISRAKSEEFFQLPQQAQAMWIEHAQVHKMNLDKQMAQQMALQNPQAGPGTSPISPPLAKLPANIPSSNGGNGSSRNVKVDKLLTQ